MQYDFFELYTSNPSPIISRLEAKGAKTLHGGNSNGLRRLVIKIQKGESLEEFKVKAVDKEEWILAEDMNSL